MMEDKQNILKSFEGKKIDESVHVARWGTINSDQSNRNIFNKYANSNNLSHDNITQIMQGQNLYATQQSQVHQIDTGFKKLKTNQIQKLKQLKQQYEVLRNLNIEQKATLGALPNKGHHSSQSSSQTSSVQQHSQSSQLVSNRSSRHKKSTIRKQNMSRDAQILALQKKQLQMVINNSMKKIEELLHNQMQYKKQLHELKLQLSSRQNVDIQYQSMIKTLKKNQITQQDNLQAIKKENQKTRLHLRQLNQKISSLESELMFKDQQIRQILLQKRKSQDLIRLQKDRYFNLDIDYKKTKMEFQLLEKDKNNQIARLNKQLDYNHNSKSKDLELRLKRYEDDLQIKDKRYNVLLTQLDDLKLKHNQQQHELHSLRSQQANLLDTEKIQEMLINFRQKNDSVTFTHQINEVIERIQQIDHYQNQELKRQIEQLKIQLKQVKINEQKNLMSNSEQYVQRIDELQKIIRNQEYNKDELNSRIKKLLRENQQMTRKNTENQKQLQYQEELESKLRQQIKGLREQMRSLRLKTPQIASKPTQSVENRQISKYKQQFQQLQSQLRSTKRLADQNEFKATKTSTQLQFRLKMQQQQHDTIVFRMKEDHERLSKEFFKIREEHQKYKEAIQRKLVQKDQEIELLRSKLRVNTGGTNSSINNIKLEYESILKSERQRFKLEVEQLSTQLTTLTKINEKYLQDSTKYARYQNQLSALRQIMRRSIHLSEGVDHLWRVKETQYQNVNQILSQIASWGR